MHSLSNVGPAAAGPTRGSWALIGTALLLVVAFVVAPVWLAGGGHGGGGFFGNAALSNSTADNFVAFWRSGDQALPAGMNDLVQYWMRYHVVKAVVAGLLMVVLAVLSARLWSSYTDDTIAIRRQRRAGLAGVTATVGGLGAAVLLMANIQGAVAPLSSVLTLVPSASDHPAVRQAQTQVAQHLQHGDTSRPALAHMVNDFGTYHAVLASAAVVMAVAAVAISIAMGRSFSRTARFDRAARRKRGLAGAGFTAVGISVSILAVANIGNAVNPAHALLLFYAG